MQSNRSKTLAFAGTLCAILSATSPLRAADDQGLWGVYESALKGAKYVDLTHTITPSIPVWSGFAASTFGPARAGVDIEGYAKKGEVYTYEKHGFEATEYTLRTDQLGTQLDPPAHWAPEYAAIDEIPASYAIRPLVVISIVDQVKENPNYALEVSDIEAWEDANGPIPEGSVVFVRSDWSKDWPDPALATLKEFPQVGLDALKFLHEERNILFHGHEPLDTDSTPTLEGEYWLMHNGYAQAEGVANLDQVPETGALVMIGYPKFGGGLGGYARYIAICPPDWPHGVTVSAEDAPLKKFETPLHFDEAKGMRVR
ncbi:cyclase family protein [Acuticoccus sp. M5D2P5]|uniref:cyclase family protein n=1 Tax=Acuticoccus kalidii TaxID=2910977 RepID=UPI001F45964A|nr:cyclase family protein [Acuticoccus kalidii]MCF3934597.1 cyclase family protein [Acuticoccus kalidii]